MMQERDSPVSAVLSSPVIERDVIYFGSTDGNVCAISQSLA
jgi:hypothetical protein